MRVRLMLLLFLSAAVASGAVARAAEVAGSPEEIRPLLIGAKAPDLTLKTGDGQPFSLREAIAEKPTVLILYRGGW